MKKPKPPRMKTAAPKTTVPSTDVISKSAEANDSAVSSGTKASEAKKPFNPLQFFTEVRQEANRVTWPTRKETWISTVMVLIMVLLASIFFFIVDSVLGLLINSFLRLLA
jgi:preprotein translocase subunit SecE